MDQGFKSDVALLQAVRMDISADVTTGGRLAHAWQDLSRGASLWRLGLTLGWLDIKLRYRGSLLGPFWLTISTAVWIGAMGTLYSVLFHTNLHGYLPFLALSLVLWTALSQLVTDACTTFLQSEATIRSVRMPYFVYAIRVVVRSIITLLVVFALFGTWPGGEVLMCLPGLAMWVVDAFATCLLLGAVCARFRDIPPIVGSVMQIAFFITPIMWRPEQLGEHGWWLPLNPFNALLDVVRQPLLGAPISHTMWAAAFAYTGLFCLFSLALFTRVRGRLAFWM